MDSCGCPLLRSLSGLKRTLRLAPHTACDPKRTSGTAQISDGDPAQSSCACGVCGKSITPKRKLFNWCQAFLFALVRPILPVGLQLAGAPNMSVGILNRLFAVAVMAAALGACAQPNVSNKSELRTASPSSSLESNRTASNVTVKPRKHSPLATDGRTAKTQLASYGVASFYSEEQQTANGEKFNPNELTAAHPTLPFGSRLRVTNLATGRSVVVRVNDRGPFVAGRVVDVSYSAAETLGIVHRGIAKVKLDVVQ